MKARKVAYIACMGAALSACAVSPERQAQMIEFNRTIPVCVTEEDCRVKWEAAQVWIVRNSGYRIQTATDVLIQTFGPLGDSSALAMSALKEPAGSGYRIVISASCANIFYCSPDPWESVVRFNREIGSVGVRQPVAAAPVAATPAGPERTAGQALTIKPASLMCPTSSSYNAAIQVISATNLTGAPDGCSMSPASEVPAEYVRASGGAIIIKYEGRNLYTPLESIK